MIKVLGSVPKLTSQSREQAANTASAPPLACSSLLFVDSRCGLVPYSLTDCNEAEDILQQSDTRGLSLFGTRLGGQQPLHGVLAVAREGAALPTPFTFCCHGDGGVGIIIVVVVDVEG